jgi:hypothetical protein
MDKITEQLFNMCINEIKNDDKQKKIKCEILDPCIQYIGKKIWPYIIFSCIVFMLLIVLITTFIIYYLKQLSIIHI